MDLLGKVEIYIPAEAEVKSFPMWSLPKSVLRRIGVSVSVSEDFGTLADSPEGICICPAIIRRKGQKHVSHAGNPGPGSTSLLHSEFRSGQMSFVCPNRTAYRVLKDTMPGKKVPGPASHTSQLPQGSAPDKYKDSVVVYRGHVYLSTRRSNHSRERQETLEPTPSSHAAAPESPKMWLRRSPQAHPDPDPDPDPADQELQRKKLCVTLPQTSQKPLKNLLPERESQSTTDQELRHDTTPTACNVTPGEHEKDLFTHNKVDVSSTTAAHSPADGEQQAAAEVEEEAGTEPGWFQPPPEEEEEEEVFVNDDGADCELPDPDYEDGEDDYLQDEEVLGVAEQRESRGAARASTSLQVEYDFKELAEEEKIARMKAKLRQSEAALLRMTAQSE
ncbi:uncharacterized protein si:dkeyp-110g5.4 isoform X2 [Etheostoma cragini]|uniref:uncharacterized protein si:dkeyp-110g5.4 isoform X2 n=1 Tax=Etheostoma cragini TaxID=417921 RepID=UPI00155ED31E|nr:uncharacterized protein si:dkeyp-110g5.4 isoform X2 [Etheostoma cragini]